MSSMYSVVNSISLDMYGYFKVSVNEYSWSHSCNGGIVALIGAYL
ncbi:hypothetical protein THOB06_50058 [Vibrio rotiferianus]|nr:hypothetical protein THOG10_50058 [Vibrio rotiferianus]CAH1591052.1 hypothetical protein THOB06_50058 [Vibrio rotiferianus]